MMSVSSSSASSMTETKLTKLKKQLSIGNIKRKLHRNGESLDQNLDDEAGHLLEDMEDLTLIDKENNNNGGGGNNSGTVRTVGGVRCLLAKSKSQEDKPDSPMASLHPIPSSLVTLTEQEKKQLEDVLMRIGLKDCGL